MMIDCRLGEKQPLFPWGTIQSVLLENEMKLGSVSVKVNNCSIVNDGVIIEGGTKVAADELQKKEIRYFYVNSIYCRFDISIGMGNSHSETVTTELNERILKHYKTFCMDYKSEKKATSTDLVQVDKEKDDLVYSL